MRGCWSWKGHLHGHIILHTSLTMINVHCHLVLWHARIGHINYDSLRMLKKNNVFGCPTILRNLRQSDAYILSKHNKQPFHGSTSRACRKLELIHYCSIPFASAFGNKYIMTFIDDYSRMCWVCLLTDKSQAFETLKTFM